MPGLAGPGGTDYRAPCKSFTLQSADIHSKSRPFWITSSLKPYLFESATDAVVGSRHRHCDVPNCGSVDEVPMSVAG